MLTYAPSRTLSTKREECSRFPSFCSLRKTIKIDWRREEKWISREKNILKVNQQYKEVNGEEDRATERGREKEWKKKWEREREKGREREREREREKEREGHRERDRERQREKEWEIETERETGVMKYKEEFIGKRGKEAEKESKASRSKGETELTVCIE